MKPLEWWRLLNAIEHKSSTNASSDAHEEWMLSSMRREAQEAGCYFLAPGKTALAQAFKSGTLDAGLLHQALRKTPLLYSDSRDTSLCQEIMDMRTQLLNYVNDLVENEGWTLNADSSNCVWLFQALEHPGIVKNYPHWFEEVVQKHPWAWAHALSEQFYTSSTSECRSFLYDRVRQPWMHPVIVEKMVSWLHFNGLQESSAHEKMDLAVNAWPQWMEHVRHSMQVHYQLVGAPMPEWTWARRYFEDLAVQVIDTWNIEQVPVLECSHLFQ